MFRRRDSNECNRYVYDGKGDIYGPSNPFIVEQFMVSPFCKAMVECEDGDVAEELVRQARLGIEMHDLDFTVEQDWKYVTFEKND